MGIKDNSAFRRIFTVTNTLFLALLALSCFLPFWYIFCMSLSSGGAASANLVSFWPKEFTLQSYGEAFSDIKILQSLWVSVQRVFLGTVITMVLTIMAAYPLSMESQQFPGRMVYMLFFVFTMLFSGGLIPSYILINNILKMSDTIWVLVVPGALPVFNVIVLMNFIRQLPKELKEAAYVDGAGYISTMLRIIIPLSLPSLATLTLFCVIGHWNAWFDALIYMHNPKHYPLQTYFQVVSSKVVNIHSLDDVIRMAKVSQRSLTSAYTIICILPILFAFPILQRHIRSGLVVGSIKS